jgi:hypothetical protein
MALGANNNQLKVAAKKMAVMAATARATAAGTNNNQLKVDVEKTAVVAVVVALLLCDGNSCKDNDNGDNNSDEDGGGRSSGGGGSCDVGGDGCGGTLGNLPFANNATIMLMTFLTGPTMLRPLQWLHRNERRRHVKRGRRWATIQRHLQLAAAMTAMD